MEKKIQLILFMAAIVLGFTACDEDAPEIDNPGVEKRLKSYVSSDNDFYYLNNYEYENDKVSKMEKIGIENGTQDTSYIISEFSYVGGACEVVTKSKSIYTSNIWEIQGKTKFEFDANSNVISEKYYEYLNGAYETSPYRHVEFSYLSSGQLKSLTFIVGLGTNLICEFNENNLLTKIIGSNGDYDYSNDSVNVTGFSFDDYSVSYSYDSENKLMLEEYYENGYIFESSSFTYNSDGLLTTVNNFTSNNNEISTNSFVYESGKGNMQSFWYMLTVDYGVFFIDVYSHKAMNKGIANIK